MKIQWIAVLMSWRYRHKRRNKVSFLYTKWQPRYNHNYILTQVCEYFLLYNHVTMTYWPDVFLTIMYTLKMMSKSSLVRTKVEYFSVLLIHEYCFEIPKFFDQNMSVKIKMMLVQAQVDLTLVSVDCFASQH